MTARQGFLVAMLALAMGGVAPAAAQTGTTGGSAALDAMGSAAGGPLRVQLSGSTGFATFLTAPAGRTVPLAVGPAASARERALAFIDAGGVAFGVSGRAEMQVRSAGPVDEVGLEHVRLQQMREGVPVRGAEIIVHLRGTGVIAANGQALPAANAVSTKAAVSADAATAAANEWVTAKLGVAGATLSPPKLEILDPGFLNGRPSGAHLAWFIEATAFAIRQRIWVDARDASILLHVNQITDALSRRVYSSQNTSNLPGVLVRNNGQAATGDDDVDTAYDYSTDTYNYYFTQHGRDSYDNAGAALISSVHFCDGPCPFANAFWDGTQMVYGEGFSLADDVDAHELTHAVTEHSASLVYCLQSGALNESFSDIFGETVDLTNGAGTDTAGVRWLMGEDIPVGAIRNMSNPSAFGDPSRVGDANFLCASSCSDFDNGGVHINSGVPNHAYALMVDGGTYNSIAVTGIGLTKAAKIEYRALTQYLTATSQFLDDYNSLQQACADLVGTAGITAGDCAEVKDALDAVELGGEVCAPPPVCGDGNITGNEQCDDSNVADGDGCDSNCTFTGCGNGVVTAGEACDDGNAVVGDGCEPDCTVSPGCAYYSSTDVPKPILDLSTITSIIPVAVPGAVSHVGIVDLGGTHTYISDLRFSLVSPANTSAVVIDRVCGGEDDFDLSLDDGTATSIPCPPTDGLTHLPSSPLSVLNGETAAGNWTLKIEDLAAIDTGNLQSWGLFLCASNCGNGSIDPGETCDDGNRTNGDCCSANCLFEGAGSACADDGMTCSTDLCDGAGFCLHATGNAGTTCRVGSACDVAEVCDGMSTTCPVDVLVTMGTSCGDPSDTTCTDPDTCDGAGNCAPHDAADGTGCDDGSICTQTDQCAAGNCAGSNSLDCDDGDLCTQDHCDALAGCINANQPRNTCRVAGKTFLQLKKLDGVHDKLLWKWTKGAATQISDFGTPTTTTDYELCVYDGNGRMVGVGAPAGSLWRTLAHGPKYRDPAAGGDGVTSIVLHDGILNRSRAIVKGKGNGLGLPVLGAPAFPVTAQLVNSTTSACFESTFNAADAVINTASQLKARVP